MVLLDPMEEIRRLIEEEEMPREEAQARVKEDLQRRQAVEVKPWKRSTNNPQYRWDKAHRERGNLKSRTSCGRTRSRTRT